IFFATSKAPGSSILPMDQSHAPILNRRLPGAANKGARLDAKVKPRAVRADQPTNWRRDNKCLRALERCILQWISVLPISEAKTVAAGRRTLKHERKA